MNYSKQKYMCESNYSYSWEHVKISFKFHSTHSRSFGLVFAPGIATELNSECIKQFCLHKTSVGSSRQMCILKIIWLTRKGRSRKLQWFLLQRTDSGVLTAIRGNQYLWLHYLCKCLLWLLFIKKQWSSKCLTKGVDCLRA